jgi:hypothetical protein
MPRLRRPMTRTRRSPARASRKARGNSRGAGAKADGGAGLEGSALSLPPLLPATELMGWAVRSRSG